MSYNFTVTDDHDNTLCIGWDEDGGESYLSIEVDASEIPESCKTFWCEFKISPAKWREITGTLNRDRDRATIEALKLALEQCATLLERHQDGAYQLGLEPDIARFRAMSEPDWSALPAEITGPAEV